MHLKFNSRLEDAEAHIPELLLFVYSVYSATLTYCCAWEGDQILSSKGVQQGDPLDPMLFYVAIHELCFVL